ncbi:MAG TPA: porin family protein [Cytophagaceae bacterium]|nr:porin family protein [Cytophagaceae bacterium]
MGPTYSKPEIKNTSGISNSNHTTTYSDAVISIMGQYSINKNFGFLLDIGLCHRGISTTIPVTVAVTDPMTNTISYQNQKDKYRQSLSYLDNHLLAKYTLGNKVKVYFNAGIYYSILLKAKKLIVDEYYDDNGSYGITEIHSVNAGNMRSSFKKSDFGFTVGTGIEYGRFGLDYRYNIGVVNISNTPQTSKIHSSFSTVKLTFVLARTTKAILPHLLNHKSRSK